MSEIDIRWSRPQDRDAILRFIEQMGFNPRDATTWDALDMRAMTAWQSNQLIAAISLEPRRLRIAPAQTIFTAHETVVAVHPDHRARGLGSAMQQKICEDAPTNAKLITVFREDPKSPAYRWYLRNGFTPAMRIDSWFWNGQAGTANDIELYRASDPRVDYEVLHALWRRATEHTGGFVDREQRPIERWLTVHPYRAQYQFLVLLERRADRSIAGYALLGVGKMHSPTDRIDILDLVSTEDSIRPIIDAIQRVSVTRNWSPIRWPLADVDPLTQLAQGSRFKKGWPFDMLIRPTGSSFILPPSSFKNWRYAPIDYI